MITVNYSDSAKASALWAAVTNFTRAVVKFVLDDNYANGILQLRVCKYTRLWYIPYIYIGT